MAKRDRSQLLRELKAAFPQIAAQLNAERGQLYAEVEVFRRFTQRAIFDGERELAERCFSLAAVYFIEGNATVRNVIDGGFVEDMEFGVPPNGRKWAWDAFPEVLKNAYVAFHLRPGV